MQAFGRRIAQAGNPSFQRTSRWRKKTTTTTFWCGHVVFPETVAQSHGGTIGPGSVDVRHGKIQAVHPGESYRQAKLRAGAEHVTDLGDTYCLLPGLTDVHTHISALGGRNWEGYTTATLAAAAGGITTLMGMPLNSLPPTVHVDAVHLEQEAAHEADLCVDVGLWGGIVPSSMADLPALLESPYIFGIKAFLAPLPPTAGYASVTPSQLRHVATLCGRHQKPVLVHAELMTAHVQDKHTERVYADAHGHESYHTHSLSRPPQWEQDAVQVVCDIVTDGLCDMHIVHLSDAGCLPMIAHTKQQQQQEQQQQPHSTTTPTSSRRTTPPRRLTVETCPHYLLFATEELPIPEDSHNPHSTAYKCFPPIRERTNRQQLWQRGMATQVIDMVASDHSPCHPSLRQTSLRHAWGGLTGLQYQLPATWTAAVAHNTDGTSRYTTADLVRWWSQQPASLVPSLSRRKGALWAGYHADLVWWDPHHVDQPHTYSKEYHRWKGDCVYPESTLHGRVLGTWVSGIHVYDGWEDQHLEAPGQLMRQYH